MTSLRRRNFLKLSAALGVAPAVSQLVPTAVSAAGTLKPQQAPGYYRYKVGDIECASINDGAKTFPLPDWFVKNVDKSDVLAAVRDAYLPEGSVTVPFNPQVINTGGKLVLVDTGLGPGAFTGSGGAVGRLLTNLAELGVAPEDIDTVVISHMHPDHTNGLLMSDGSKTFANAEIMVPAKDWDFWMDERNAVLGKDNPLMKNYFSNVDKIFSGIRKEVNRYDWGKEVAPGVTAIGTPGHTPGHTSFAVSSGSSTAFIQSDVTNIPEFFLRNPDWHVGFDKDPEQAQETRHKFYDMVSAEKASVIGFHFSFPSIGHVEKDGAGYRLIPVAWSAAL